MLSSSQPSGKNDKCEPKQNNCSGAGTGPACDDGELGAYRKKVCLEDVRNRCEKKLEKCLEICKDTTEQAYRSFGRPPDEESRTDGVDDQVGDNYTVYSGIIPVIGYWWADAVWTPSKDNFIEPEHMAVGPHYGVGARLATGDYRTLPHPHLIMINNIDMCRDCYEQAMMQCVTADCYCGQLKCPFDLGDPGGAGGGGGEEDPTIEDVNAGEVNSASYETTSLYDIPVELVYTRSFLPGNVFFLTEPREVRTTKTTAVRDPVKNIITRTHTLIIANYSDLFIGLCAGEIGKVTRVFFDGAAVYSANNASIDDPGANDMQFVTMTGSESQKVRGDHAKVTGFGRTPAYRGLAYMVVKNFNFSAYDDFPAMKFEVVKEIDPPEHYIESATIPALDTSVWRIDGPANRVVVGTATGVRVLSLESLEEVWSETIPNVLDVTPLGKVLTYDGSRVGVYDPGMGEYGSFEPSLGITQSFVFRTADTTGNAGISLISADSSGDMMLEEIDDITPSFPTDSVAIKDLAGIDTEPPEVGVELFREGADHNRKSLFFARVVQGSPDILRVRELRMFSTNPAENLMEDEQWYSFDLPASTFGGTSNLTLQGVIPCQTDGTLIFAYLASGTSGFVKWSPEDGVVWTVEMPSVPYFGKYAPTDNPERKKFGYLANATTVYILDLVTGAYSTRTGAFSTPTGIQYYDSATSSIIYQSAGNRISRAFLNRVVPTMETLEMVAKDLAERAGIDPSYVDAADVASIQVNGIRSGTNTDAASIITQLVEVYLAVPAAGDFLTLRRKANNAYTQVNSDDLETTLDLSRLFERVQDKSVTIEYFSDNLDGDQNFQTFSLISGDARSAEITEERYSYTVLEDDTHMKQLAEMFVHTDLNARDSYSVGLPPRYLALTTGDVVRVNGRFLRISGDSLGADNTLELTTVRDAPDDYAAYAPLTGTAGFGALVPSTGGSVAAPIFVSARPIEQQITPSAAVYAGASDILAEFSATTTVGLANDESTPAITGGSFAVDESLIWGRLEEMNAPLTTAVLKSFPNHNLAIRFPTAATAQRVLDKPSRYGDVPDPRTEDSYYHTLLVGKEVIQYGYALAHPSDDQVVYFHNLIRGLHNTDDALDHTLGEMCILVETATVRKYELRGDDAAVSLKLTAVKPKQGGRRGDATPYDAALLPVVPGYLMRQDFPIQIAAYRSSVYPGNPAVMISFRQKGNLGYGLTEDSASLRESGSLEDTTLSLYLLRAAYDPILFEAERNGTGTSYIVARVVPMPFFASSSDYAEIFDIRETYDLSYIWRGDYQSASQWNHQTEPIVAVIVSENAYGESRAVFEWHAAADYTRRPTRGLYGSNT